MKGYWRDIHAQNAHILHDKGIHTDAPQFADETFHLFYLIVIYDGIDCNIYPYTEFMGIVDHTFHIFNGIGRLAARTMSGSAHIHRVSTMIYSRNRR